LAGNKIIFIFDFFEETLRELLIKQKRLSITEIRILLIQINEAIKHLKYNDIYDIILSPENIGINKDNVFNFHSIKLFNLFPYRQFKKFLKMGDKEKNVFKSFFYSSPEEPNYKDVKNELNEYKDKNRKYDSYTPETPNYVDIRTTTPFGKEINQNENINYFYSKSILWNIGLLIYELFYGELPSAVKGDKNKLNLNNLKKSGDNSFDDLIQNLLLVDSEKRIKWDDYVNHKFFKKMEIKTIFNVLFKKEFNDNLEELDLISENIDNNNLILSSPIKFNNLIKINLSCNKIKDLSFLKEKFRKLKFLIVEDNYIENLDVLENNTLEELEFLSLKGNFFNNLHSFTKKNWSNLNYLSLSKNNITDIYDLLKVNLPNLNVLNLSNNKIVNIDCFKELNFPELRELFLNNNKIEK
jgi:hypothetical protein